jgi:hypothetical protein
MHRISVFIASFILIFAAKAIAQPIIADSTHMPGIGFFASLVNGPASTGPGSGGAAVTWDLSGLTLTSVGTYDVLDPAITPLAASYPSGNYVTSVTATGGSALYTFYINSATGLSELANSVTTTAGSGRDYTPGPRKILKFPFNYLDTFTATYATSTTTGHDFSEYDGYGTLITPWTTYTNIVRVKTTYTTAVGYAINWYILNPLLAVLTYDSNSGSYTGVTATLTSTTELESTSPSVSVYPNPVSNQAAINIPSIKANSGAYVVVADITGKELNRIPVTGPTTTFTTGSLNPGIYFYKVVNSDLPITNGKFIVR